MQIREVTIKNFRSIRYLNMPVNDLTLLIGENNSGKTSVLEAIRIALSRSWGRQGTGFTEYDFFMDEDVADPKHSDGICIELKFREDTPDQWPEPLMQDLHDLIQTDSNGFNSITLRAECAYNEALKEIESSWSFLDSDSEPLTGKSARASNFSKFFDYVPVFSLAAVRDAGQEFGTRSKFWAKMLKSVNVDEDDQEAIEKSLDEINTTLLSADPKLEQIRNKLTELTQVFSSDSAKSVRLRALPLKIWDLLSRTEVNIQGRKNDPWLPIERHGQGVQSLSVIYLFQSFVEIMLASSYGVHSEPILLLEEPEAHLHPQAARSLGQALSRLSGQVITSTHSPQLMERTPFEKIRVVRRGSEGSVALHVARAYKLKLPNKPQLGPLAASSDILEYDDVAEELVVAGKVDEDLTRRLIRFFTEPDERAIHGEIRELQKSSQRYISDIELRKVNEFARRIRGEIFFSTKWILCEGATEYVLLHAFFEKHGFPLDSNGISVIDFQNGGSAGAFVALAEELKFPWVLFVDGDKAGDDYIEQATKKGLLRDDVMKSTIQLAETDIEEALVVAGLGDIICDVMCESGVFSEKITAPEELITELRNSKTEYSAAIAQWIYDGNEFPTPKFMEDLIEKVRNGGDE